VIVWPSPGTGAGVVSGVVFAPAAALPAVIVLPSASTGAGASAGVVSGVVSGVKSGVVLVLRTSPGRPATWARKSLHIPRVAIYGCVQCYLGNFSNIKSLLVALMRVSDYFNSGNGLNL
jgi:hypothetical protein